MPIIYSDENFYFCGSWVAAFDAGCCLLALRIRLHADSVCYWRLMIESCAIMKQKMVKGIYQMSTPEYGGLMHCCLSTAAQYCNFCYI